MLLLLDALPFALFFFSIQAYLVECQGSAGYLVQKAILIRSIKRKAMLLSKPFTLNYSIELYLQATETKKNKNLSMALDKVLAKLVIYFIYFDNFV